MLPIPPITSRREIAGNRFFSTIEEDLATAAGPYTYNFIESKWDAVIVVPVLPDGRLVIERIYRHPYRAYLHEFPAGGIEQGEQPLIAAARELEEETGWRPGRCRVLGAFAPIPGLVRMRLHVVLAEELSQAWTYAQTEQASAFLLQGLLLWEHSLGPVRSTPG